MKRGLKRSLRLIWWCRSSGLFNGSKYCELDEFAKGLEYIKNEYVHVLNLCINAKQKPDPE